LVTKNDLEFTLKQCITSYGHAHEFGKYNFH
jgi:hypothetical protein